MKKVLILIATMALVVALGSTQAFALVFSDTFDTQINPSVWTQIDATYQLTWDGTKDAGGSPSSGSAKTTWSRARMYHNLGADMAGYFKVSWSIFDDTMTRPYGEIESRVGGTYTGLLNQLFAAGKYGSTTMIGEVFDITKYQGRLLYPGAIGGWFNLSGAGTPSRSPGWHKFDIERLATGTVNYFVDNVLSRSFTGANAASMNVIVLGFGTTSSSNGNAWFDNAYVTDVVPEPGSLLALGTGLVGLFGLIRRRK